MKIKELNISEFGCLKNKKITLDDGMNVIYGENESGKSTILLFIKFMLYGLGRRSASNSERERSVSWSGHTAAGSMTFSHGGKEYRVERRYTEAGRSGSEKLSVICLDSGNEIGVPDGVGEYFLGVPREVFESSACVGQMSATEINGEKVSGSIQNILTSADESVDTAKILKKLDAIRVTYRHKSKNGGSLYDAEQQISAQRQRLEKARDATLSLDEQTQKLTAARRELDIVKRDFEYQDKLLSEFNKINIIKRFDECKEKETRRALIASAREKYTEQTFKAGYLPTRQHLAELDFSAKSLETAQERVDQKKVQLDGVRTDGYDERACELAKKAEEQGGAAAILRDVEDKKKKSKKCFALTAVLAVISGIVSGVGIALAVLMSLPFAFVALATVVMPIIAAIAGAKKKKTLTAEITAISSEYDTTPDGLAEKLETCSKALAAYRDSSVRLAKAEAELSEAQRALESAKAETARLLDMTSDSEPTVENARTEYTRLNDALNRYELLLSEEQTLERMISAEKEALCHYDEDELRAEVSIDVSAVTPAAVAEAERSRKFLLQKKSAFEQKIGALNDYVIGLRANAADPLPIADGLAELEKKYAVDSEFYDALTLAMESIEKAGSVMSGSVMPAIASQASEIMGRISKEKYTTLRATSSFGISLDSEGFGIKSDFLSGGTKDCAYLSLRIALFMKIFGDKLPPLVLDEALCQFDDERARRALQYLAELGNNDVQCVLFTSHKREKEIFDALGAEYNLISL